MNYFLSITSATCTHTHTHTHTCIHTHIHTHTHIHIHTHTQACTHTYACTHIHTNVCAHSHAHTQSCMCTKTHKHMHIHTQTCLHTHTHTYYQSTDWSTLNHNFYFQGKSLHPVNSYFLCLIYSWNEQKCLLHTTCTLLWQVIPHTTKKATTKMRSQGTEHMFTYGICFMIRYDSFYWQHCNSNYTFFISTSIR